MPDASRRYRLIERRGPAGRLVLRHEGGDGARLIVCSGFAGPELPATVTDPRIESAGDGRWRLRCGEGEFEFRARAVEELEQRPALYLPLHRAFALRTPDRLAVRFLLALLRLPGGSRLLRLWHDRRG